MPQEISQLKERIDVLERIVSRFVKSDKYYFDKHIVFANGVNISASSGTGTKIGASADKLSVYGETPVVQAGAITAAATQSDSYVQADVQSIASAVNSIRTALTNFGISA